MNEPDPIGDDDLHALLRAAVHDAARSPLPPAWERTIATATGAHATATPHPRLAVSRRPVLLRGAAIAASVALLAGVGGAAAIFRWRDDSILADARAARNAVAGSNIPPHYDVASGNAQLQATLGFTARIPDMARYGFQLVGLQLFRHAAQLSYRDARQRRLTIYVRPSSGTPRFDLLRRGKTRICVWQDDVVGAVIMAPMDAGEMMRVASRAYADLNL